LGGRQIALLVDLVDILLDGLTAGERDVKQNVLSPRSLVTESARAPPPRGGRPSRIHARREGVHEVPESIMCGQAQVLLSAATDEAREHAASTTAADGVAEGETAVPATAATAGEVTAPGDDEREVAEPWVSPGVAGRGQGQFDRRRIGRAAVGHGGVNVVGVGARVVLALGVEDVGEDAASKRGCVGRRRTSAGLRLGEEVDEVADLLRELGHRGVRPHGAGQPRARLLDLLSGRGAAKDLRASGKRFERHDARGPNVGAAIDVVALETLRRTVCP